MRAETRARAFVRAHAGSPQHETWTSLPHGRTHPSQRVVQTGLWYKPRCKEPAIHYVHKIGTQPDDTFSMNESTEKRIGRAPMAAAALPRQKALPLEGPGHVSP